MKKSIVLACLAVLFVLNVSAQIDGTGWYFGIGYNVGSTKNKPLNYIVDKYNSIRPYLDHKMDNNHILQGMALSSNFFVDGFSFDMGWTGRHTNLYAQGIDGSGVDRRRDIKLRDNSFYMGFGGRFMRLGPLQAILGFSMDIGAYKARTRVYATTDKAPDYTKLDEGLNFGISPNIDFRFYFGDRGPSISVKPYYQFQLVKSDLNDLNEALNPTALTDADFEGCRGYLSNFGAEFKLMLPLARRK
ncbi:MAG: hypothetical protein WCM76_13395 [Bacteroidota bacterium]